MVNSGLDERPRHAVARVAGLADLSFKNPTIMDLE